MSLVWKPPSYRLYKVVCHLPNKVERESYFFLDAPWKNEEDLPRLVTLFGLPLSLSDDKGVLQKGSTHAYKGAQHDIIHVAVNGDIIHEGVPCANCNKPNIVGTRYKCKSNPKVDLCAKCYNFLARHLHDDYYRFDRILYPPSHLIGKYMLDTLMILFANYAPLNCLGYKQKEDDSQYTWITYSEFQERFINFGSGLRNFLQLRSFVGICAPNCPEWLIADFACLWFSFIGVPIHFALDKESIEHILNHSAVSCLVCSSEFTAMVLGMQTPKLRVIVQLTPVKEEDLKTANAKGIKLLSFSEVEQKGKAKTYPPVRTEHEDISAIYYTSGSTGKPKGVVFKEKTVIAELQYLSVGTMEHVQLEYLPFGHAMARDSFFYSCFLGGQVALFNRDMKYFFEELQALRPTRFRGVPSVWHKLHENYLQNIAFHKKTEPSMSEDEIERLVRSKTRAIFGDRIQLLTTGSAPINPTVVEFIKRTFPECYFLEQYGCTEVGGVAADGKLMEGEYKLLDCPELGYFASDTPYPRGELAVRSSTMAAGYYKDEAANKEGYTEDGFFKTGDIVEWIAESQVRIIDRKKNFFKLSQGEFIRSEHLETIFAESPLIHQILITGSSFSKYVVAIIVPSTKNDTVQNIKQEIMRISTLKNVPSYEIPKILHVTDEPFTVENRGLTPSFKKNRPFLRTKFADTVNTLVKTKELQEMLWEEFGTEVSGTDDVFGLAGDSLSKVRLVFKIKEKFGQEIPFTFAYSQHTLSELVNFIDGKQKVKSEYEEFLDDYNNLDNLLPSTQSLTPIPANESPSTPSTLLLTGATGFLGIFLLHEILRKTDFHIWCLVRCREVADGLERIRASSASYGNSKSIDTSRITILPGDLSEERLGLSEESFARVCATVDVILHNGAIVNWQVPYSVQRKANVFGTKWILEISTLGKPKPILYISSISTLASSGPPNQMISISDLVHEDGYLLSKWLAEFIVRKEAQERNKQIWVVRPGMITGHSISGMCNHSQFLSRYMRGISDAKVAIADGHVCTDLNPVDLVSETIVNILTSIKQGINKDETHFNIANFMKVSYNDVAKVCCEDKPQIETIPYLQWRESVLHNKENALYPLLPYFPENQLHSNPATSSSPSDSLAKELQVYNSALQNLSPSHLLRLQLRNMM